MAAHRESPYPGVNFVADLGAGADVKDGGLWEVVFPQTHIQTAEYRNGNDIELVTHKIQTTTRYGSLLLRRGVTGSLSWYAWWDAARNGVPTAIRPTISVTLLSEDRSEKVLVWRFSKARPVSHQFSPLNALGTAPLIETLEIEFESLSMDKGN